MYYLNVYSSSWNYTRNNLKYLPKESYNLCLKNTSYMCNPAANHIANDGIPGGNGKQKRRGGQEGVQEQAQKEGSWADRREGWVKVWRTATSDKWQISANIYFNVCHGNVALTMATHTHTDRREERRIVGMLHGYYVWAAHHSNTPGAIGYAVPCCGPCPVAAPLLILPIKHKVIMSSRLRKWVKITITMWNVCSMERTRD